ncbi:MAG TPA: Do family serine endopeptidase [Sedimentisphaerales bacterium]|nr:Do family serine endopeptidase [Sedimentisphaerales bacterium]
MQINSYKKNKNYSHLLVISTLLLLFTTPLSALAADPDSIAALRQMGKAFSSIAEKASPAVVGLKTEKIVTQDSQTYRNSPFGDDFFDYFFGPRSPRQRSPQRRYQQPQTALGSGFVISSDGYILTNNHMVEGAEKVVVELADGRKFNAEITGTDPDSDIAVIKIDADNLPYLELADSDTLEVGEWVLAIGNPLGFSHTVTAGIVSAKGRSLRLADIENFIQTDAAINRGNSGGPLLNLEGKVVGMNTAIYGATGNIGIGFAIPVNMAKHAYKQIREGGSVERGFLGISLENLTPELAAALDLKTDTKGVAIGDVRPDTAAEKAGLKRYDVIIEFEGQPVEKRNEFLNRVAMLSPDTKVEVVVLRDGKRKTFTVTLGKRPPEAEIRGNLPAETIEELGFSVINMTEELAKQLGYEGDSGVVVREVMPGSQAEQAGIVPGVLIKEVNRRRVYNTKDFNEEIKKAQEKGRALLLIRQDNSKILALIIFSD